MSRSYYDDQGDSIPQYYPEQPYPHSLPRQRPAGRNSSRIPQPQHYAPQDRRRIQPSPMNPGYSTSSPNRARRQQQEPYYPEPSAWDVSQSQFYDGSGYADQYGPYDEQYEQQWPLPVQPEAQTPPNVNSSPRKTPRRPPRPEDSPNQPDHPRPVRDTPRSLPQTAAADRQYHTPSPAGSYHGNGQWTGDGYAYAAPMYPPPSRPLPQANPGGQSGIPQYVPPQMPQQAVYGHANRRPPLGPPPSARRGPANYYPQVGPVHPIAEETDSMRGSTRSRSVRTEEHNSKTSFASSNAIPIGIPHFYIDEGNARPSTGELSNTTGGRPSTPSDYDDDDQSIEATTGRTFDHSADASPRQQRREHGPILVRQASLGKKSRPTLVTQGSGDKLRRGSADREAGRFPLPGQQHARKASREALPRINTQYDIDPADTIDTQHGIETLHSRALAHNKLEGQAESGADTSKLSQQNRSPRKAATTHSYNVENRDGAGGHASKGGFTSDTRPRDPSSLDESGAELKRKRSRELLGAAIAKELHPTRSTTRSPLAPSDDERVKSILHSLEKGGAISVEEANELKQPTGGLSERAGKRRPSRINVDAVHEAEARGSLTSLPDLIRRATKLASNLDRGKTASRLGMENWLNGATEGEKRKSGAGSISDMLSAFPPPHATPPDSRGGWRSSHLRHTELPSDSDAGEPKKRGRPCCGMPLWLFIVLISCLSLLVAAAVVVPVMLIYVPNQNKDSHGAAANSVGRCHSVLKCENGGTDILSSNGRCECLCVNGFTGRSCSTYSEQGCTMTSIGSTSHATVGEAIPRLLKGSSSNFSVPLDGRQVLGLFSASDLSCAAQNALVTFNNKASKRSHVDVIVPRAPTPVQAARQATSHGLLVATGSPSSPATAKPTATSSGAASTSTAIHHDQHTLDFARVAVLFVLQDAANIDQAADAQEALQAYFRGSGNSQGQTIKAQKISLSTGYSCNLVDHTIITGNGTTVGKSTTS